MGSQCPYHHALLSQDRSRESDIHRASHRRPPGEWAPGRVWRRIPIGGGYRAAAHPRYRSDGARLLRRPESAGLRRAERDGAPKGSQLDALPAAMAETRSMPGLANGLQRNYVLASRPKEI